MTASARDRRTTHTASQRVAGVRVRLTCADCPDAIEPGRPNAVRCVPCGIAHDRWANVERKRARRANASAAATVFRKLAPEGVVP